MDLGVIEPGDDVPDDLMLALSKCGSLLPVIGGRWIDARERFHNPKDWVYIEINTALKRKIGVIPTLIDGAAMPRKEQLPPGLEKLANKSPARIRRTDAKPDAKRLSRSVKRALLFIYKVKYRLIRFGIFASVVGFVIWVIATTIFVSATFSPGLH